MTNVLYIPWHRRREHWQHDHNMATLRRVRDWKSEKVATVGKLVRVGDGRFEARCPCGTLFMADARRHIVDPPVDAMGII